MSVTVRLDNVNSVLAALKSLGNKDVLVGVPDSNAERSEGPITNAAIGYINETGSPSQNIPERPHLVPGVASVQQQTAEQLGIAAKAVLSGDEGKANRALHKAGKIGRDAVKAKISASDFTPLADATVAARARRGRKGAIAEMESRKAGNAPDNTNARPLIDTGSYRNSIIYIVRDD